MKVNYEEFKNKLKKTNLKLVDDATLTKEKRERVRSWAMKKGLSIKECESEFRKNKLFRSLFTPDVSRQNVYEKAFHTTLAHTFGWTNVSKLHNGGDQALYVEKGQLRQGSKAAKNLAKSVDFDLVVDSKRFVISHKYTDSEGGSQDNQFTDVQLFLQECKGWKESNTFAIAVVDGEYYKRFGRLNFLKNNYETSKVFVTTSDKLESLIKSLVSSKKKKAA